MLERVPGVARRRVEVASTAPRPLTRFANSVIHQNVAEDVLRVSSASTSTAAPRRRLVDVTGDEGLASARRAHARRAAVAPLDPGWPGRRPAGADSARWRRSTRPTARRLARRPGGAGAAPSSTPPAAWRRPATAARNHWRGAFANSAGQALGGRARRRRRWPASPAATAPTASARPPSGRLADIDGAVLGARAAAKANAGVDPVELPPDRYEVVLEPSAVADILEALPHLRLQRQGGRRAALVRPPRRRPVRPAAHPVRRRPARRRRRTTPRARRRRRVPLVDAGTTVGADPRPTHGGGGRRDLDRQRRRLGLVRRRRPPPRRSPAPAVRRAEVDGPVVDSSTAALVAGVERGVLVTDFWYTRVLDPRTLVAHRADPQRRVADRGRRGHAAAAQLPLHPVLRPGADAGHRARRRRRRHARCPATPTRRRCRGGRRRRCAWRRGTSPAAPAADRPPSVSPLKSPGT